MKKFAFAVLTLSVLAASTGALAEEEAAKAVKGGSGQISFTGVINNDACSVDGASGNDKMIAVDMGSVSIKDMGTDSAPGAGRVAANDFNLKVNCNAGTKVSMRSNQPSTAVRAWLMARKFSSCKVLMRPKA